MQIINQIYSFILLLLLIILPFNNALAQEKEEETYSISLTQTAEVDKKIYEIEDKKVLTEIYTIKKGDHVWQLFRERGLLKKRNLVKLISVLKRLNTSLANLDLVHPGQKIIIPLKISPISGEPRRVKKAPEIPIPLEALKDLDVENYTVKPGDKLIKVVEGLYSIPTEELYDEYLQLIKRLNPSIDDLNIIYPGQVIRLPIYSPQTVRMPILPIPQPPEPEPTGPKLGPDTLRDQLGRVFTQIGEEWVESGEHFIPLESGGQINLKAESFPIINLSSGNRVIVDLRNDLPQRMTRLIESSWENYRIVHLGKGHSLRRALAKILPVCQYSKVYKAGEPLKLGGDIPLQITADWIIRLPYGPSKEKHDMIVITFLDDLSLKTPKAIKDFLATLGIKTIDYPPGDDPVDESADRVEILKVGNDMKSLVGVLLNLAGPRFTTEAEISVYQSQTNFNLIIKADFLLNINGKECIIDLTGLGSDIISLLREHQFLVLPLSNEKDPSSVVTKVLDLLGVQSASEPHHFMATKRDESRNIRLTIPGIIFQDNNGQTIFATHLKIPEEVARFLSQRGYKVFSLILS